jgi:predicted AAA+ superfamily ATPase
MDVKTINELLSRGETGHEEMWPHLADLKKQPVQFKFEFGLETLPTEPGLIIIRGARQYGKSTWLEMNLKSSVETFGKGSAYFLNGDEISSADEFADLLLTLDASFSQEARVKRLFIDEVTAIPEWQRGLKRVWDRGHLRDVLVINTGSKAIDLRRGSERLPGRKGKLARNEYIFLPVSYSEFHRICSEKFTDKTWLAYLITGGSPIACNEMYANGRLPEYFIQLIRDWILGEVVSSGRSRVSLSNILHTLYRFGGSPVGYAKLARESGLANNTVAAGYIEQLSDLLSVIPSWQWDQNREVFLMRKPSKFHFINLAAAVAFHPSAPRSVDEFLTLPEDVQGMFMEWLVAQEIWRNMVLSGRHEESIGFWKSDEHEIDFVIPDGTMVEVKKGRAGPLDFSWFSQIFPKKQLYVVCSTPFESRQVKGMTFEKFLLQSPS